MFKTFSWLLQFLHRKQRLNKISTDNLTQPMHNLYIL